MLGGLLPQPGSRRQPRSALYLALGILGATVMPHNLYLHSSIVQTRAFVRDDAGRAEAIRYATLDSNVALGLAFFINAAILILSAAAFHRRGMHGVAEIQDAYRLLTPTLGRVAGERALRRGAAGQRAKLHADRHAGGPDRDGRFPALRLRPWLRRLITRALAVVPAAIVAAWGGETATGKLLVFSQVVLSVQLSFAVMPLVMFTNDRRQMGRFANAPWLKTAAWTVAALIAAFNVY